VRCDREEPLCSAHGEMSARIVLYRFSEVKGAGRGAWYFVLGAWCLVLGAWIQGANVALQKKSEYHPTAVGGLFRSFLPLTSF
jgi:hypothetical protein